MKNSNLLSEESAYATIEDPMQVAGVGSIARMFSKLSKGSTRDMYNRAAERKGPSEIERQDMGPVPGELINPRDLPVPEAGDVVIRAEEPPPVEAGAPVGPEAPTGPEEVPGASPLDDPGVTLEDARDIGTDYYGAGEPVFRTSERNINLNYMDAEDTGDMGRMLDATAAKFEMGEDPRTFEQIEEAASDTAKVLAKVLTGEQLGLMTDVQKHAARQVMVDLSDRSTALANEIANGNQNKVKLLEYRKVLNSLVAWQTYLQKDIRETARALNQQKMIATAVDSKSIAVINDAVMQGGSAESIIKQAKNHQKAAAQAAAKGELDPNFDAANQTVKKWSWIGIAAEYWKNNLLSGPSTHVINTTSNAAMNAYESLIIRPIAAGIGAVRSRVTGNLDRVSKEEVLANGVASYAGIRDGIIAFTKTLTSPEGESGFISGAKLQETRSEIRQALKGKGRGAKMVADAATISFRLLQAEDDLFKTVAYRQQLTNLAIRDGVRRGLTGDALDDHAVMVINDPPTEIHDEAAEYARKLTFTNHELEGYFGLMQQLGKKAINARPEVSFLLPFITTPTNVMQYAFDNSATAFLSPRIWADLRAGGAKADMAGARLMAGTTIAIGLYFLHDAGLITGNGPRDDGQRKMLEATGWKQLSIWNGEEYISLRRGDPFATMMAMVASNMDANKYSKHPEAATELFFRSILILTEHVLDGTYMKSLSSLFKSWQTGDFTYLTASIASGMVPYSSMVATIERGMDPEFRRPSTDWITSPGIEAYFDEIIQRTQARLPFASRDMRPARYWDGEPIMPGLGVLARMILPVQVGHGKDDPATTALFQNGVSVGDPDPIITIAGKKISLPALDSNRGHFYDAYIKRVGEARRVQVEKAMKSRAFKKADGGPGSERSVILQGAIRRATDQGFAMFVKHDAKRLAQEIDPEDLTDFSALFSVGVTRALKMIDRQMKSGEKVPGVVNKREATKPGLPLPPHL